jgi:formate dehydrogenase subunit delta
MNIDHLIKMANEIAAFYVSASANEAPQNIASHLTRFWEPRMRKAVIEHARQGGVGLNDAARQAVEQLTN